MKLKKVLLWIWTIAVMAYPVWYASAAIPIGFAESWDVFKNSSWSVATNWVLHLGIMDKVMTGFILLAMGLCFTPWFLRRVSRAWRCVFAILILLPVLAAIARSINRGEWNQGADAFNSAMMLLVVAAPIVFLGHGFLGPWRKKSMDASPI